MSFNYRHLLHFLFPPSNDELLISECNEEQFLSLSKPRQGVHAVSLLPYTDPRVRAAIHLAKFHNHKHAKKLLAATLALYITSETSYTHIIPVPLSSARKHKRGYNQVEEIIKIATMRVPNKTLLTTQLRRVRNTPPQTALSKKDRLQNVRGAFALSKKCTNLTNTHILLIDDVVTTGATLTAAKQALQKAKPASITCIALAH
jgi:ComF family protein